MRERCGQSATDVEKGRAGCSEGSSSRDETGTGRCSWEAEAGLRDR